MPNLKLVKGDERARKFLEEGASIADFLSDPLRPCVVQVTGGGIIALNRGSVKGNFFSSFWSQRLSITAEAYVVEYMADEAVILQLPHNYVRLPRNPSDFLEQRGACELRYVGDANDIRRALVAKGFAVEDPTTSAHKWDELEEQRRANLHLRTDIAKFYLGE